MRLCRRYARKHDGSAGWSRAHDRFCVAGCALDVMGEIMVSMPFGRVFVMFGCRIGETNGGHFSLAIWAKASIVSFALGHWTFGERFSGLFWIYSGV
jgi:hypothetical protein